MTTQEINQKLLEIVKVYLPQDVTESSIKPESHLMQDLGINSAHLVDIVLDVEDTFDIMLDENDMQQMQRVEDATTVIQNKL
ncbi:MULTISPECIES: acyl carrier protein [Nonlabens]|uniref:acyl carrier protein n=1 Tax=Nonlabens TaxID=363408 RepID=UPI000CF4DC42|nr:phosphopantetheine-binding protein [Nonlabens tegetincola]PQJ16912.1 acyl carrier protein [Nonlabens tegetincola]